MSNPKKIRFIDLFSGIGGIRKGFELACADLGVEYECVFTSEIKPYAVDVFKQNHPEELIHGDITKIQSSEIPDFDFMLAGFPCQAFSAAGKRLGFSDTRGTLFFEVERIIKEKSPYGFVLENVEGLVNHDKQNSKDPIGRTLSLILDHLNALNYMVNWRVLNAKDFGVPPMFTCLEDFISAVEETVYQNPKTHDSASTWKRKFLASYEKFYGVRLSIPRWDDIAEEYINKKK